MKKLGKEYLMSIFYDLKLRYYKKKFTKFINKFYVYNFDINSEYMLLLTLSGILDIELY